MGDSIPAKLYLQNQAADWFCPICYSSLISALNSPSSVKNWSLKFYPLAYSRLAGHSVVDAGRRHGQFIIIIAVAGISLFILVPEPPAPMEQL